GGSRRYFTNCGISVRGSQSIRDGNNITISSTSNIGMNRIAVSLTASLILMPPIEQAIIRQRPYGGVTRPYAIDMTPMIAKWMGCIPTLAASGARIVPTIMMAGIASMKQPMNRNATAVMMPTVVPGVRTEQPAGPQADRNSCAGTSG